MGLKKMPSGFNYEELLDVLENTESEEVLEKPNENSVIQFLADFGIYPGVFKVNSILLSNLYKKSIDNPVTTKEFHLLLRGYLKWEQETNYTIYYLNKEALDLTKQLAEFLAKKKKPKKVNTRWYRHHIEKFIKENNLKKGIKNIPMSALYYLYDKWQYKNTKTRLTFASFGAMIKLYFDTKRTNKIWCVVKIDKQFFGLYPQEAKTAIEWAKKFDGRYGKKETKIRKEIQKALKEKQKIKS